MALPTVADTLGVSPPAYVRKVDALGDWGNSEDDLAERLQNALRVIFLARHKSPFSFYLVKNDTDLRRVVVALNENRRPQIQKLYLLAFLPDEIRQSKIEEKATAGRTRCPYASALHRDLTATDEQLTELCEAAMKANRNVAGNLSKAVITEVFQVSRDESCLASVPAATACKVAECAAHS